MGKLKITARYATGDYIDYHHNGVYIGFTFIGPNKSLFKSADLRKFIKEHGL
jgi:hypothetical protein